MSSPEANISQFEELLVALARAELDFAVVGGVAVAMNGYVRTTRDVDILVDHAPDNIRRLLGCLASWGEGWGRELNAEEFILQEGSIRIVEDFPLDVFTQMRGRTLADFRPRLREQRLQEVAIRHLGPADLIFLKEASWRDHDKIDVLALTEILRREAGQQP